MTLKINIAPDNYIISIISLMLYFGIIYYSSDIEIRLLLSFLFR